MPTFANTINDNQILAKRSQCDYAGNDIQTTYATKTEVTTGLASKQDTISDLSTIRSGAAAGATAVQPGSLATVATTGDYDDLLNKPSIPAAQVNSDWNSNSGVSQILNKPTLATVATTGSYSDLSNKPTIPTVDQTYNASSANAQSGVAVAQAIAAAPAGSYTAGDGIEISAQDEISVAYDTDTLQINSPSSNIYSKNAFTGESGNMYGTIEDGALAAAIQTANSFTLHIPGNTFSTLENMTGREILLVLSSNPYFNTLGWNVFVPLSFTTQGGTTWIDEQNVTMSGFGAPGWVGDVPFYPYAFRFEIASDGDLIGTTVEPTSPTFSSPVLFTYGSEGGLAVKNPLPSSDVLDEDKVLTVNSNGTPVWAAPASVTVDQVYNASSTNAQSGTAVAGAISGINQVPASTSSDADKVLTVNAQGTPAWASAQAPITAGNGIDITNNVVSVDTSVVATQTDLADKEDAFDVGTGLEMDTSGATPTLQVETPVDIVAGPGIVIDNPDGNTLRVSTDENYKTLLYTASAYSATLELSEPPSNFEYLELEMVNNNGTTLYPHQICRITIPDNEFGVAYRTVTYQNINFPVSDWFYAGSISGTTISIIRRQMFWHTLSGNDGGVNKSADIYPTKIYGVHRINGGN